MKRLNAFYTKVILPIVRCAVFVLLAWLLPEFMVSEERYLVSFGIVGIIFYLYYRVVKYDKEVGKVAGSIGGYLVSTFIWIEGFHYLRKMFEQLGWSDWDGLALIWPLFLCILIMLIMLPIFLHERSRRTVGEVLHPQKSDDQEVG
jgi:hypothetical protein